MNDLEKIKYYIIAGGFDKQSELADFLGVQPPSISDWKKFGRVPEKHIKRLEKEFGIIKEDNGTISFIGGEHKERLARRTTGHVQTATGNGNIQVNGSGNNTGNRGLIDLDGDGSYDGSKPLVDLDKPDLSKAWGEYRIKQDSHLLHIPYYENIKSSAGFGAVNGRVEDPEMFTLPRHLIPSASKDTEAIRCAGDSMSPSLQDGDIMFIDRANTDLHDGEIYVVRVEDELYVKRLVRVPGKIIAKSDNNSYPDFELSGDNFEILGRVIYRMERVWWVKEFLKSFLFLHI